VSNPYAIDPKRLEAKQKSAAEQVTVTLKNHDEKLPPTIGTQSLQGIPFGGQSQPTGYSSQGRTKRFLIFNNTYFWFFALLFIGALIRGIYTEVFSK